jgi:hypothetical protein
MRPTQATMRSIRFGFAIVFALAALVCARVSLILLQHAVSIMFLLPSLSAAAMFAFAAWVGFAHWRGIADAPGLRAWSLAASVLMILASLFAIAYMQTAQFRPLLWAVAALGYAGLAVFAKKETKASAAPTPAVPTHDNLPGDGTTAISSKLAALAAALAALEGTSHWSRWGAAHSLPLHSSPLLYLKYLAAVLLVLFLHEGGHAAAGLLLRMKVVTFIVGPFRWWKQEGHWHFEFRALDLVSFLGAAGVVPTDMRHFRRRKLVQVAAGPIASLVTGLLAVWVVLHAPGHAWAAEWRVLTYFATISLVVALLNFIPFKLGAGYSDGAKLYQLSRRGLWADYHRLVAAVHATQVTALRPRDYDIRTVERAAGTIARGADELNMHLCAYACYLDKGQLDDARAALLKAEALCNNSTLEPSDQWYSEFVFAIAFLRHDAAAARTWWNRMQSRDRLSASKPQSRLASRCALLLSEGRIAEAAEVWKKADAWSRQLPRAGATEAQRHSIQLLGRALQQQIATVA